MFKFEHQYDPDCIHPKNAGYHISYKSHTIPLCNLHNASGHTKKTKEKLKMSKQNPFQQ